jgi:stage V sporulation protein R
LLKFLLHHAPLERWQQEILSMVREEAYYFAPQGQTKIMNEAGLLLALDDHDAEVLSASEVIDFADHHAGTMGSRPGRLNPYKVGIELYRDIEERWNRGKFGKEWEECDDYEEKKRWDKRLGLGRAKIFDVRRTHNDVTFIDLPDAGVLRRAEAVRLPHQPQDRQPEIAERDYRVVKEHLLFGSPTSASRSIYVIDGNYKNRGELLLQHRFNGLEIQLDNAGETLKHLHALWGRPVHLQTASTRRVSCSRSTASNSRRRKRTKRWRVEERSARPGRRGDRLGQRPALARDRSPLALPGRSRLRHRRERGDRLREGRLGRPLAAASTRRPPRSPCAC